MLEIVLFIASKVVGGTSFWIRVTSNGSISCIILERTDFLDESAESELGCELTSSKFEEDEEKTIRVLGFLGVFVTKRRGRGRGGGEGEKWKKAIGREGRRSGGGGVRGEED